MRSNGRREGREGRFLDPSQCLARLARLVPPAFCLQKWCQISNALAPPVAQLQKDYNPLPPSHSCHLSTSIYITASSSTNDTQNSLQDPAIHPNHNTAFFSPATHSKTANMPPKAADKKPASKAPATASKAPEKKDAGKKTAATGEKKKRTKTRKETYSSYIYKGEFPACRALSRPQS